MSSWACIKNETPHCSKSAVETNFQLATVSVYYRRTSLKFTLREVFPNKAWICRDIFLSPYQPISSAAKIATFLWIHPISIPKGSGSDWRVLVLWFTLDVKIIGTCIPAHALKPGKSTAPGFFISLRSLILFYSLQMLRHTHGHLSQIAGRINTEKRYVISSYSTAAGS